MLSSLREATKEELQDAFGVTLDFEGGRVGAPNQVQLSWWWWQLLLLLSLLLTWLLVLLLWSLFSFILRALLLVLGLWGSSLLVWVVAAVAPLLLLLRCRHHHRCHCRFHCYRGGYRCCCRRDLFHPSWYQKTFLARLGSVWEREIRLFPWTPPPIFQF